MIPNTKFEILEEMITPIKDSESVNSVGSSYINLENATCYYDITNGTCDGCSNSACKKWYSFIVKKGEKLLTAWEEEESDEYKSIVKNHKKKFWIKSCFKKVYISTL